MPKAAVGEADSDPLFSTTSWEETHSAPTGTTAGNTRSGTAAAISAGEAWMKRSPSRRANTAATTSSGVSNGPDTMSALCQRGVVTGTPLGASVCSMVVVVTFGSLIQCELRL